MREKEKEKARELTDTVASSEQNGSVIVSKRVSKFQSRLALPSGGKIIEALCICSQV